MSKEATTALSFQLVELTPRDYPPKPDRAQVGGAVLYYSLLCVVVVFNDNYKGVGDIFKKYLKFISTYMCGVFACKNCHLAFNGSIGN